MNIANNKTFLRETQVRTTMDLNPFTHISKLLLNSVSGLNEKARTYFNTRERTWKSEQIHKHFADVNSSYLIDAINQGVTWEAHVERRSAGDFFWCMVSRYQNLCMFVWRKHSHDCRPHMKP